MAFRTSSGTHGSLQTIAAAVRSVKRLLNGQDINMQRMGVLEGPDFDWTCDGAIRVVYRSLLGRSGWLPGKRNQTYSFFAPRDARLASKEAIR